MSKQGLARDPNATFISLDYEQILGKFKRALIIDDELDYANSVRENLEFHGFDAKVVVSLDAAAQELFKESRPIIICDNIFIGRSNRRGSEFIRDNTDLIGSAQVILMSGYPESQIIDFDILKIRGIKFLGKHEPDAIDRLLQICREAAEVRAQEFTRSLEELCIKLIENTNSEAVLDYASTSAYLVKRAKMYLINYIRRMPDQESPQFVIMGKACSPHNLIDELDRESEISRMLVDQLLDDVLEPMND